jgi:hypothetical protein
MKFWMRSFNSFWNPVVETPLGHIAVWGNEKTVPNDEVSGSITLQAKSAQVEADWPKQAEALLMFLWRGLAFAHGSRLQSPRTDYYCVGEVIYTFYHGASFASGFPTIPFLEQGPFIKALCARYFQQPPLAEMIWTAIGWLHLETIADEGRFVSAMTALETVVEHLIPKGQTTVVPKHDFTAVRDQLIAAVEASTLSDDPKAIYIGKLKGLNARSLSQKVEALRDHYGLAVDKYDMARIVAVIKLRNAIVHTGVADQDDIWDKILFVRELIADIVFHEIGYTGVRESYLDGHKIVHPKSPEDNSGSEDINLN